MGRKRTRSIQLPILALPGGGAWTYRGGVVAMARRNELKLFLWLSIIGLSYGEWRLNAELLVCAAGQMIRTATCDTTRAS